MVLVVVLHGFAHEQEAAMGEGDIQLGDVFVTEVSYFKEPRFAEGNGRDGFVFAVGGEGVVVPGDGVITVAIVV